MPGRIQRFIFSALILLLLASTQGEAGKPSGQKRFEAVVGELVKTYNADDAARFYSHFSESLQVKISLDVVNSEFQQSRANFGKIVRFDSLSILDPYAAEVKLVFEKTERYLSIWLDEAGRIDWLEYKEREEAGSSPPDSAADVHLLDISDIKILREVFQEDSGRVRLVTLLAPT